MSRIGRGIFITGTDTDIGKTVAAAATLISLRNCGVDAVPMKPVQTGGILRGEQMLSPDLDFCFRMAGIAPTPAEYRHMAPYIFEPACSPHLAAQKSGRRISFDGIKESFSALLGMHESVVVEGAGGLMVPIFEDRLMLDLMVFLGLPVILVARPGLGTINHSLLSLRELERSGLKVPGVLFCEAKITEWGEIEQDNLRTVERIGKTRVLGRIPYIDGLSEGKISPEAFRSLATEHLCMPWDQPQCI
ncbi:MAG: dethiobiotin synthase [Syntrophobacteraceae bacterium]